MAFNTQEQEIIKYGIANGKTKQQVSEAISNYRLGIVPTPATPTETPKPTEPSLSSKLGSTAQDFVSGVKDISGRVASGETNPVSGNIQLMGNVAETGLKGVGNVLTSTPVVGESIKAVAQPIGEGIKVFQGWLENNPTFQKVVTSDTAQKVASVLDAHPDIARNAEAVNNIVNAVLTVKGGLQAGATAKNIAVTADNLTKEIPSLSSSLPKDFTQKAVDLISADPEAKVATILKESKPQDVTKFIDIAKKASVDPRVATPFEVVGNNLADTTKVLESKLKEIGKAKSDIIQPTREGLSPFKNETTPLIEKLNSLKNNFSEIDKGQKSVVSAIIKDAKTISTKLDADKFIDKVQNALYTGNRDMTIVQGSALDKQLRGLIGEYNNSLKASLPEAYGNLNKQYSDMVGTLNTINNSLGDIVEGVPIRGASLIKQFFSPSGSKAKEIFDFVKKETNGEVDLAKEATLAKFAMELYGDTRARSLLQGISDIPTTIPAITSKVIEKIGGDKLQNAMRESTIRKAKEITSPK